MNDDLVDRQTVVAIERARRMQELGFVVKSQELEDAAASLQAFAATGGNREMRRRAARARRKPGR